MADNHTPESKFDEKREPAELGESAILTSHTLINSSGHRDQLDRQYGILSICGMALTVDNAWVAIGTSMNVAICGYTSSAKWDGN